MLPLLSRPCLYCVLPDQVASCEHVLQEAFDATLTLDEDVCDACNTKRFSPLDTELIRFVRTHVYPNVA